MPKTLKARDVKGLRVVSVSTHLFWTMLIAVKSKDLFRMGGTDAPSDLVIPDGQLKMLLKSPYDFILCVALNPTHKFSVEEISKVEGTIKYPEGTALNRVVKGPLIIWSSGEGREDYLWKGTKPTEGVIGKSIPCIVDGAQSFWPLPLQRQGPYSHLMWEASLPAKATSTWLDLLGGKITKRFEGCFWTISRR